MGLSPSGRTWLHWLSHARLTCLLISPPLACDNSLRGNQSFPQFSLNPVPCYLMPGTIPKYGWVRWLIIKRTVSNPPYITVFKLVNYQQRCYPLMNIIHKWLISTNQHIQLKLKTAAQFTQPYPWEKGLLCIHSPGKNYSLSHDTQESIWAPPMEKGKGRQWASLRFKP
jgi:hypothetical protein